MKAVVLAGGYATRLWPITRHRPKMFLPLGETTIIDRLYDDLERDDRIGATYVSTNERFAPAFEEHLADGPWDKPRLSVERTREEGEKFGVVGALEELIARESIDDDLLVLSGDNVIDFELGAFLDRFDRRYAPTIAVHDVGDRERAASYGVVELDDDRVVAFREKPDEPEGTLVSTGCYAFPRDTLALIIEYLEAGNDPDEPGWFVSWLHSRVPTYAFAFEGDWFDVGTLESYLDAVAWYLDGESLVDGTASLKGTTVGSNVHVMAETSLVDVDVERAVIFSDVTLERATVRGSIVDEGAALEGVNLDGAMIGAYTQLPDGSAG